MILRRLNSTGVALVPVSSLFSCVRSLKMLSHSLQFSLSFLEDMDAGRSESFTVRFAIVTRVGSAELNTLWNSVGSSRSPSNGT